MTNVREVTNDGRWYMLSHSMDGKPVGFSISQNLMELQMHSGGGVWHYDEQGILCVDVPWGRYEIHALSPKDPSHPRTAR